MWLLILTACTSTAPVDTGDGVARGDERFALPVADPTLFDETQRLGVDHDPEEYEDTLDRVRCTDYLGRAFPWCYDGHYGTDLLLEGGFEAMDAGSAEVVAAAPGVVVDLEQEQYDRCHLEGTEVSCDGHPMVGNFVLVEHPTGVTTLYLHLMKHSVVVEVGDQVECGTALARVGSSGNSSTPHLHFQVEDAAGRLVDPFAGPYSQPETWWLDQGDAEGLPGSACAD